MLLTSEQYKNMRESYCYSDRDCKFALVKTDGIDPNYIKIFHGIFSGAVPPTYPNGINTRKFELIVKTVFADCKGEATKNQVANLKEIICAIAHWKMASQGGRAQTAVAKVRQNWNDDTYKTLIKAYSKKDLSLFRIGGVAIPTATAILRFIYPEIYGIMDSRVAKIMNDNKITNLNLRADGYIINSSTNLDQYKSSYNPFLTGEAKKLNTAGIKFNDIDENGNLASFEFRPCDIEMALFCL